MNAYKELFSRNIVTSIDDINTRLKVLAMKNCTLEVRDISPEYKKYTITPDIYAPEVQEWLSKVKFASIRCSDEVDYFSEDEKLSMKEAILPSKRTSFDEEYFLRCLQDINYDSGYGIQYLYGVIVFKDNSWLSRQEYDGKESWVLNRPPIEEDYIETPDKELKEKAIRIILKNKKRKEAKRINLK